MTPSKIYFRVVWIWITGAALFFVSAMLSENAWLLAPAFLYLVVALMYLHLSEYLRGRGK